MPGGRQSHRSRSIDQGRDWATPAFWAREYADLLNDALDMAPPERRQVGVSTRGLFSDAGEAKDYWAILKAKARSGKAHSFEAISSSSIGTKALGPGSYKGLWVRIHGKSGVDVSSISSYSSEREALLGTRTQFEVLLVWQENRRSMAEVQEW